MQTGWLSAGEFGGIRPVRVSLADDDAQGNSTSAGLTEALLGMLRGQVTGNGGRHREASKLGDMEVQAGIAEAPAYFFRNADFLTVHFAFR